jgi:NTE family protein
MKSLFIALFISISVICYSQKTYKVGICLSGGAALGYAHIGVLQALEENGIYPEVVSGSSMGAIIGALYAKGIKPAEILQIIQKEKMYKTSKILHFVHAKYGLSSHKSLRTVLQKTIITNNFDSLKLPFFVCVSNLTNAKWKVVGTGKNLQNYIVASASIPGIFEPVIIDDSIYVDGGLFNNLPTQVLRDKCDYVIGVDVLPLTPKCKLNSTKEVLLLSSRELNHINSKNGRTLCDFLIEPLSVLSCNEMDFEKYLEVYKMGYDTTIEFIKNHPEIKNLATKNPESSTLPVKR